MYVRISLKTTKDLQLSATMIPHSEHLCKHLLTTTALKRNSKVDEIYLKLKLLEIGRLVNEIGQQFTTYYL